MVCTFFGHRYVPQAIESALRSTITELIKADYSDTILPEGIETVPKRFAITYRNKWMLSHADVVVTYITRDSASGAAQFRNLAEKSGKKVINLYRL